MLCVAARGQQYVATYALHLHYNVVTLQAWVGGEQRYTPAEDCGTARHDS
jgi:hypothetical protein